MTMKLHCAAILFDSDGVLVHSQPVIDRVLRNWAAEHGLPPDRVIELSRGRRDVELVQLVAPWLNAERGSSAGAARTGRPRRH
jgi:mannitol-1-/sugar-/sorbitol-6-phosphatase